MPGQTNAEVRPDRPLARRYRRSGMLVALGDGSVRFLPQAWPEKDLQAMITCNGGEIPHLPD